MSWFNLEVKYDLIPTSIYFNYYWDNNITEDGCVPETEFQNVLKKRHG